MWSSTGNAVTYTNWAAGQPDNSPTGADYLTIGRAAPFNWFDEPNTDVNGYPIGRYFICEF